MALAPILIVVLFLFASAILGALGWMVLYVPLLLLHVLPARFYGIRGMALLTLAICLVIGAGIGVMAFAFGAAAFTEMADVPVEWPWWSLVVGGTTAVLTLLVYAPTLGDAAKRLLKRKGFVTTAYEGKFAPGLAGVAVAVLALMYVHDYPNVGPLHWTQHGATPACVATVGRLADGRAIRLRAYGHCIRGTGISNSYGGAVVVRSAGPTSAVLARPFGRGPQGNDVFTYPAGFTDFFKVALATSTDPGYVDRPKPGKASR